MPSEFNGKVSPSQESPSTSPSIPSIGDAIVSVFLGSWDSFAVLTQMFFIRKKVCRYLPTNIPINPHKITTSLSKMEHASDMGQTRMLPVHKNHQVQK